MAKKALALAGLLLLILFAAVQPIAAQAVTIQSHTETGAQLQLPGILHKPSGEGPFPAIVMLSGCGGVANPHDASWAERLVEWGYAALQVDSFTPRGFPKGVCENTSLVSIEARSHDAFAAKSYLSKLPFVDPNNIAVIGWSHGGVVVMRIIDAANRDKTVSPFKAAVAFYPYCQPLIYPDTPVVVLIGEKDDWCPASLAESLKSEYRNWGWKTEFSLTTYPNASHAFDEEANKGGVQVAGHRLDYDPQATSDSIIRTRDFLAKYIGGAKTSQREAIGTLAAAATSSPQSTRSVQPLQDVNVVTSTCGCSAQ